MCVCVRVCARVRAYVCACVRVRVCACECVRVQSVLLLSSENRLRGKQHSDSVSPVEAADFRLPRGHALGCGRGAAGELIRD